MKKPTWVLPFLHPHSALNVSPFPERLEKIKALLGWLGGQAENIIQNNVCK